MGSWKATCGMITPRYVLARLRSRSRRIERQDPGRGREEQAEREVRVERFPPAEGVAGEHEGRQTPNVDDAERGSTRRSPCCCATCVPEVRAGQHVAVGVPDPRVGQAGRVARDLPVAAEPAEDHIDHRPDRHRGDRESPARRSSGLLQRNWRRAWGSAGIATLAAMSSSPFRSVRHRCRGAAGTAGTISAATNEMTEQDHGHRVAVAPLPFVEAVVDHVRGHGVGRAERPDGRARTRPRSRRRPAVSRSSTGTSRSGSSVRAAGS